MLSQVSILSSTPTYMSKTGSCACLRALYVPWLLRCVRDRMTCRVTVPKFQNSNLKNSSEIPKKFFLCGIRRNFTDKVYDFYGISKSADLTAESEIFSRIPGSKFEIRKFQLHIPRTAA